MLETIRGLGLVFFITVLAGVIAYVGDRVGHQVGRRRLTLFGMRPKYTSTIIAVGTGMVIALLVTVSAILASQEVKTAFFRLNTINSRISELEARAHQLQTRANEGILVVPFNAVMAPFNQIIPKGASAQDRYRLYLRFYRETVAYINEYYPNLGLQKFLPPADVNKKLVAAANDPKLEAELSAGNVMLAAVADQNLFAHDKIHFGIYEAPDMLVYPAKTPIASIVIPSGKTVSINYALIELRNAVAIEANKHGMPALLLSNFDPKQTYPDIGRMATMLTQGHGTYLLTAYAAENIYPHTGGLPVVITLQHAKAP
ncbi:MAG: DUF3084 domain-containing protein [Vulcanimicrobiaceae bacterium]